MKITLHPLAGVPLLALLLPAVAVARPPNIVYLLADDLGYQRDFAHASVFVDLETKKARINWKP